MREVGRVEQQSRIPVPAAFLTEGRLRIATIQQPYSNHSNHEQVCRADVQQVTKRERWRGGPRGEPGQHEFIYRCGSSQFLSCAKQLALTDIVLERRF